MGLAKTAAVFCYINLCTSHQHKRFNQPKWIMIIAWPYFTFSVGRLWDNPEETMLQTHHMNQIMRFPAIWWIGGMGIVVLSWAVPQHSSNLIMNLIQGPPVDFDFAFPFKANFPKLGIFGKYSAKWSKTGNMWELQRAIIKTHEYLRIQRETIQH